MNGICLCGRKWHSLTQAHCSSGCHQHFSTVANFDKHRPGSGGCQDPAALTNRKGEPVFKAVKDVWGITWKSAVERPEQAAMA